MTAKSTRQPRSSNRNNEAIGLAEGERTVRSNATQICVHREAPRNRVRTSLRQANIVVWDSGRKRASISANTCRAAMLRARAFALRLQGSLGVCRKLELICPCALVSPGRVMLPKDNLTAPTGSPRTLTFSRSCVRTLVGLQESDADVEFISAADEKVPRLLLKHKVRTMRLGRGKPA